MLFIRGDVVHTPVRGEVETLVDQLLAVTPAGLIAACVPGRQEADCLAQHGGGSEDVWRLKPHQFLLPGFVDTHLHASQYSYAGTATDTPLMSWLEKYAFPTESRFGSDLPFARDIYSRLIRRLLACGTTTACFFATLHCEPCQLFADLLQEAGMRALVGKVSMDRNSPEHYVESTAQAAGAAEAFILYVQSKGLSRLQPVLTPRFLPTCTPELLSALGQLAARYHVAVQSHISESYDEVDFVQQLHPGASEVELFDAAGLMTSKTVMAHGVLLSDAELAVMAARGTAVAHCPLSNLFFADRLLPVAELLRRGVKVGLGTDVAGGYEASMLSAMRAAVLSSRALHIQRIESAPRPADLALRCQRQPGGDPDVLSWRDTLWLGTMGGAQALGLEATIGSFGAGKEFDALLVDGGCGAAYDLFPQQRQQQQDEVGADQAVLLEGVEKFLNCGDDRHIAAVWVQGRQLKGPRRQQGQQQQGQQQQRG